MVRELLEVPELPSGQTLGLVYDWRPGKRLAIWQPSAGPGLSSWPLIVGLVALVLALGACWGAIRGDIASGLYSSFKMAIAIATAFAIALVVLRLYLPEQDIEVDWQSRTVRSRRDWRTKTLSLDDLRSISLCEDRLSDEWTSAELKLVFESEQIELLSSVSCRTLTEAMSSLVVAGERLAEVFGVPCLLPNSKDRQQLPTIGARELAQGYTSLGTRMLDSMKLADSDRNIEQSNKYRAEAIDYFTLANQLDPTYNKPLIQISRLSDDPHFKQKAVELAFQTDADSADALLERAQLHWENQHWDLARQDFDAAVRLDRSADTLRERAEFLLDTEDFASAIEDLNEAIKLNTNESAIPYLLDARAACYHARYEHSNNKPDLKQAIADWNEAVSINPEMITRPECILIDDDEDLI